MIIAKKKKKIGQGFPTNDHGMCFEYGAYLICQFAMSRKFSIFHSRTLVGDLEISPKISGN